MVIMYTMVYMYTLLTMVTIFIPIPCIYHGSSMLFFNICICIRKMKKNGKYLKQKNLYKLLKTNYRMSNKDNHGLVENGYATNTPNCKNQYLKKHGL